MAYFASLMSLKHTTQCLLDSSEISILPSSREILEFACALVASFEEFLESNEEIMIKKSSNERLNSLKGQITEAAYKLEDALESQVLNRYDEGLGDHEGSSLMVSLDLKEIEMEIDSFAETMKKIEKMMMEELSNPLPEEEEEEEEEEDDDEDVVSSSVDLGGKNSKMVGLTEQFTYLKELLINALSTRSNVISIVGMAGIGKTTLAMKIFENPSVSSHFHHRAFVTISPKYQRKKAMQSFLSQIQIHMEEGENLAEYVCTCLRGKRCLIVFDDVWNTQDLTELLELLPLGDNGSRIVLTTRLEDVGRSFNNDHIYNVRFLSKEESWDLLREKVFGEGYSCPYELEKVGKKIAEKCEGLPLTIITVANILSKEEKTLQYWQKVAENENSVFTDAYDQMYDVLSLSYDHLPHMLKPCFLYMGVFPLGFKVPASKLVKMWCSEGFVAVRYLTTYVARVILSDLVSTNIVLGDQESVGYVTKTCKLHSVYLHLCLKEARKEKFLHVINRCASISIKGIESQRRCSIHNNVIFGIKEAHDSIDSISMARSLLCTGPYHQYPVPLCFGLRLLRVLDALTIRFYKFPVEVLKLVRLKYLALTYSGKIPGSISKLWNLEVLIVHRHMSINKSSGDSSYLPIEIWNMKELRHIQVPGSNLPDPCGASLPNLLTLSDISVSSCSKMILGSTPDLMKLGLRIELSPDAVEPLLFFDHLPDLQCLASIKCVIVNPKPRSQVVAPITTLPFSLTKLSLSGLGYPWKYMRVIAEVPHLEVLKLRCYAFQGPVWETYDGEFPFLKCLILEDTDLVHWRAHKSCFPYLRRLILKHCYKLQEIPSSLGWDCRPELMQLVDCPSFGVSEKKLQEQYRFSKINIRSSLDEEK